MRTRYLLVMLASAPFVLSGAAFGQVPPVGPGHCVANCGGGGGGGGSRGGGGGGNGAAIGSAIGLGMAIGGALMQQHQQMQQQQNQEQSSRHGNHKRGRDADDKKVAKGHDSKSDKTSKDDEKTHNQTEKPPKQDANANKLDNTKNQQQAKQQTGQPAGNPPWTGCVGKVGTVWNAGNCGHPTFPATATAANSAPQFHRIPYFVPIVPHEFVDALSCPMGFKKVGETFYGGTKCAPDTNVVDQSPPATGKPPSGSISSPSKVFLKHVPECGSNDGALWVELPNANSGNNANIKLAYIGNNWSAVSMEQYVWREVQTRGKDGIWKSEDGAFTPQGEANGYLLTTDPHFKRYHRDVLVGMNQYSPDPTISGRKQWMDRPGSLIPDYSDESDYRSVIHAESFLVRNGVACAAVKWERAWYLPKGTPGGNPNTSEVGIYRSRPEDVDTGSDADSAFKKVVSDFGRVPPPAVKE